MSATHFSMFLLMSAALAGCQINGHREVADASINEVAESRPAAEEVGASSDASHSGDHSVSPAPDTTVEKSRGLGIGDSEKPRSEMTVVRLFYATDREWTGSAISPKAYGNTRCPEDRLDLGYCYVSIPEGHRPGELERPAVWKLEFTEDPKHHIVLADVVQRNPNQFYSELKREVSASPKKQILLFVHGYNCTFEDAAQRAAQLAFDLNFNGAPMLYSWPSAATVPGYAADESSAEWTRSHLVNLLLELRARSGAEVIHVIAHSMGARVFSSAVAEISKTQPAGTTPILNQIVLAAPDIDRDVFKRDIAPRFASVAERVTIYASSDDRAIQSSKLFHSYPRLGEGATITFPAEARIDLIDVSGIDTSLLGIRHSSFAEILPFLKDIREVLRGIRVSDVIRRLERKAQSYRIRVGA